MGTRSKSLFTRHPRRHTYNLPRWTIRGPVSGLDLADSLAITRGERRANRATRRAAKRTVRRALRQRQTAARMVERRA